MCINVFDFIFYFYISFPHLQLNCFIKKICLFAIKSTLIFNNISAESKQKMNNQSKVVNVKELIDIALAVPNLGVVNLMILRCLLHIIVQKSNLQHCDVQFQNFPHERIGNTESEPTNNFYLAGFRNGQFTSTMKKETFTYKIKAIEKETEDKHDANDILNCILEGIDASVEPREICKNIVSDLNDTIMEGGALLQEDLSRTLAEELKKKKDHIKIEKDLGMLIGNVVQNVFDCKDPFIRNSEIGDLIMGIVGNEIKELNDKISNQISDAISSVKAKQEILLEHMNKEITRDQIKYMSEETQKSQLNPLFANKNVDSVDYLSSEPIRKSILVQPNENRRYDVNEMSRFSRDYTPLNMSDTEQLRRNVQVQTPLQSDVSSEVSRDISNRNTKFMIKDAEIVSNKSRFCGGKHTITDKKNNNLMKNGFKDQHIESIVNDIRQKLRNQLINQKRGNQSNPCCGCRVKNNSFAVQGNQFFN